MMQIGIIGFPLSGKTTIFNLLTGNQVATADYSSGNIEPNIGVIKVPDERLNLLAEVFKPKKVVHTEIEYIDIAGLTKGSTTNEGIGEKLLANIRNADALLNVVKAFGDSDSNSVISDIESMDFELLASDLSIANKRLERVDIHRKKGLPPAEKESAEKEYLVLSKVKSALDKETPIRDIDLSEEEAKLIRGYQFMTAKPMLIVINIDEKKIGKDSDFITKASEYCKKHKKMDVVSIAGKIESEISQLSPDDAKLFMDDLGLKESGVNKLIKTSYHLLGLISFLTYGPNEVRAWAIPKDTTAAKSAGTIHSDMEKGFIRAEVISYNDFAKYGSIAEVKKHGLLRLEGKDYIVKDGDMIIVRFNV